MHVRFEGYFDTSMCEQMIAQVLSKTHLKAVLPARCQIYWRGYEAIREKQTNIDENNNPEYVLFLYPQNARRKRIRSRVRTNTQIVCNRCNRTFATPDPFTVLNLRVHAKSSLTVCVCTHTKKIKKYHVVVVVAMITLCRVTVMSTDLQIHSLVFS